MVSKKVILALVAVVVIIGIAAIAIGGSDKTPDARYNYELSLTDSFTSISSGSLYEADEGKQYLVVKYMVYNDSYKDGISTNDWIWVWKATAGGLTYSCTLDEALYPGHQTVTVAEGGHGGSVELFEIPDDITLDDITISQEYTWTNNPPVFQLDTTIQV